MSPTLEELAKKYSSDKLYWHSYIPIYESLFHGGHMWTPMPGSQAPGAGPALSSFAYCQFCRYRNDSPEIPPCINKGVEVRRLLEIGIGFKDLMVPFLPAGVEYVHGSSLKMWEEYFPEAEIFACDIREDALINEGRIRSMVCDQSSPLELGVMCGVYGLIYDVIIDDGSHQYEQQRISARMLLRYSKPSLYVIEDVWEDTGLLLAQEFNGQLIRGEKGRDDNMVVIRR